MGYLNHNVGHRKELLTTRSVVKKNNYVILEPDGLVKNAIPGYTNCDVTILASPELGASFADYLVTAHAGGRNDGVGGEGIEVFLYVVSGEISAANEDGSQRLTEGGYFYSPADRTMTFQNQSGRDAVLYVYRRRYLPYQDLKPGTVTGSVQDLEWVEYEGMSNCHIKDLLPAAGNFAFDMNMHILKFAPGASHGYVETHFQEHGMYFLQGKGVYLLDEEWIPLEKGDYVFMDSYCPQCCYGAGDEDYIYIYSKDCNRDVQL